MINVLVTAKDGQLGHCFQSLVSGHPNLQFTFKSSSELDITNKANIEDVFGASSFDYCINCAAYTAVDKAEEVAELADKVNHLGAQNLAEACKNFDTTLIHISTDFVFDGQSTVPYLETNTTSPLGVYGKTKLEGECAITEVLEKHFIVRTSWLYSEYKNNFLKTMLRLSDGRDELSVVGDQVGSPTYAKDLAEAVLKIIESKKTNYGVYHYSNQGVVSWYGFAKEIFKQAGVTIKLNDITTAEYPTLAERPKYSVLDTNKIKDTFEINIPDWETSLHNAILALK
ncbi:dTDP-4-dehydrorhamnose reductase [Winogradskyella undariae]|uniref:dTDP-4-dehydrorhamnose reductase n=1 Tax=Winogradskyella undariae TaxID=1285465 RepID=UPI00156A968B|nr:dTDP-4-dehydrorhamnose reductase [Winogradskyella undariae]NRR91468.1 dTDP-4-dehydrorhamnose reductase [Winogradskyella undariae]